MKLNTFRPWFLISVLVFISLFGITGCQSGTNAKNIRIGISPNHVPWEELSSEGNVSGISTDFITAYEDKYGVKTELIWLEPSELTAALDDGRIDCILSSVPATEALMNQYSLSDPYIKTFSVMLSTTQSPALSKSSLNSEHVRIALLEGSSEEALARSQFSNAEIQIFKNRSSAVDSLLNGLSDVFLSDALSALSLYANYQSKLKLNPAPLSDQYQYFVVVSAKDNPTLTDNWNDLFSELRSSGYYDLLYEKYVQPLDPFIERLNLQIEL